MLICTMLFYHSSWTNSKEENGGEAPDRSLKTPENEEAVPEFGNLQHSVTVHKIGCFIAGRE